MARPGKLKVFRTAIGFHDAYVAAPSRKAALAAWGASRDLFARKMAEEVTDPDLSAEPLAHAGEVIRRSRGDAAAQFAALPPSAPRATKVARAPAPAAPGRPKPSRDALAAAEAALAAAAARHEHDLGELDRRIAQLERERTAARQAAAREAATLERARECAEQAYRAKLEAWRR